MGLCLERGLDAVDRFRCAGGGLGEVVDVQLGARVDAFQARFGQAGQHRGGFGGVDHALQAGASGVPFTGGFLAAGQTEQGVEAVDFRGLRIVQDALVQAGGRAQRFADVGAQACAGDLFQMHVRRAQQPVGLHAKLLVHRLDHALAVGTVERGAGQPEEGGEDPGSDEREARAQRAHG